MAARLEAAAEGELSTMPAARNTPIQARPKTRTSGKQPMQRIDRFVAACNANSQPFK